MSSSVDLSALTDKIARADVTVLILGETGVGKEVLAQKLHNKSRRCMQPFVTLNCAALHETLLESELFGHERGAFTGADRAKKGLIESAHGGTIFLDEIGEMPLSVQPKLLRVLEQREVLPVGAVTPRKVDVRVLTATNRNLEVEIRAGRFRQDLYYRLNTMVVTIPPLRERRHEIPELAHKFATMASERQRLNRTPMVTDEALGAMLAYPWPGNIRELRNVIERATLLAEDGYIRAQHIPTQSTLTVPAYDPPPTPPEPELGPDAPLHETIKALERERIVEALRICGGNQSRAAKLLGISRSTILTRIRDFGLARPRAG